MTKAIAIAFGIALTASTAYSQPRRTPKTQNPKTPAAGAPAPAPAPPQAPDATPPAPPTPPKPLGPDQEKADPGAGLKKDHVDEGTKIPEVSPERRELATKAFQEGNSFLNDGIFPKAVERYTEAIKSWDHPAIHYNMALALMYLDRPIEQFDSLQKAIKYGPGPLEKDKFDHAREYMVLVEKQLASVEVSCQKEGARVTVDGKEVFTVEKGKPNIHKGRIRIGKHAFVAEKPGYATSVDAPFIGPGEVFRIELKLYTAEELTRHKRRWETRTWAPWAVIGGGAVLGLVGGALQLSASSSYKDFDTQVARCTEDAGNNTCNAGSFDNLRESGDTKRTLGIIGYSVAGAAIVTGGLLVYLNRRVSYQITTDEYRLEELRKQKQQKTVSIVPLIGPDGGGVTVLGRF